MGRRNQDSDVSNGGYDVYLPSEEEIYRKAAELRKNRKCPEDKTDRVVYPTVDITNVQGQFVIKHRNS
jgi:hypothetical protein